MTISRSRKRQRAAVQQAAGAEFLPGAGVAGHDAKQQQRRRAAHDAVELRLNLRCIRRLQAARCAAGWDIGYLLCYN